MGLPEKLKWLFRRYGYFGGFSHILRSLLSRVLKVQLVYKKTEETFPPTSDIETRLIKTEDELEFGDLLDQYCPEWRERFQQDNYLVCVYYGGEVAGFGWARWQCEMEFSYVDSRLPLNFDFLYIYDCITLPDYRGRRVFQAVLYGFSVFFDHSDVYVACRWNNTNSIRGIGKAGFMLDRVFLKFDIFGFSVRFNF